MKARIGVWLGVLVIAAGAVIVRVLVDDAVAVGTVAQGTKRPAWVAGAALALVTWIGGAILFARRAIQTEDRFSARPAALAGVIIALGAVMWLVGLKEMW